VRFVRFGFPLNDGAVVFVLPMETTPFAKFPAMRTLLDDPTMKRLLAFAKLGLGVPFTSVYPGMFDKFTPFPMSTLDDPVMPTPLDVPM
jgi:hypothetical protein